MHCKGKLTSWNEEKGFGFITPADGGKRIFVHITSFLNRGRQPEVDLSVTYKVSSDNQGRPCAVQVALPGDTRKSGTYSYIIGLLFFTVVAGSVLANKIPLLILVLYFVLSLLTFFVYAKDKSAARRDTWRTPESTLHLFSLVGGWPGALIAQQKLRHKSKKQPFRFIFWTTVLLNCSAFSLLFIPMVSLEVQYWIDVRLKFWIDNTVMPLF